MLTDKSRAETSLVRLLLQHSAAGKWIESNHKSSKLPLRWRTVDAGRHKVHWCGRPQQHLSRLGYSIFPQRKRDKCIGGERNDCERFLP